jgi:hypothetical protein
MEMSESFPTDPMQLAAACEGLRRIVTSALCDAQCAALDLRDAVTTLERLHKRLDAERWPPNAVQTLQQALEHGAELIQAFDAIGLYDPVPISMLE